MRIKCCEALVVIEVLSCLAACGRVAPPAGRMITKDTAEASPRPRRRDPTPLEASYVLLSSEGCAAFWVRNAANRPLVITARHCADYAISKACDLGLTFSINGAEVGRCQSVVAAQEDKDTAMIEMAAIGGRRWPAHASLRLAATYPPAGTSLVMIGFPVDSMRNGRLTTSDSCWTRSDEPFQYLDQTSPDADLLLYHNCLTWGGNSGGPMLAAGTDVVVGMPMSYDPNGNLADLAADPNTMDPNKLMLMNVTGEFVNDQRAALDAVQVETVTSY